MKLFVTIPTRGDHPELLQQLVTSSGVPRGNVIIVRTAPTETPTGTVTTDDFGEINIQRWWNRGIDIAVENGADFVAVLNDDLTIRPGVLQKLAVAADLYGAALATPGRIESLSTSRIPLNRKLIGSIWILNVRSGLRPDNDFRWWFGDDDLDIRARRNHGGVISVPVDYEHVHASAATDGSSVLQELIDRDRLVFKKKYPIQHFWRFLDRKMSGRLSSE